MNNNPALSTAAAVHRSYFVIYALTFLGSTLTGISCFLQVGIGFPDLQYVSAALALKTCAMLVLGLFAPRLIFRFNLRLTLVLAQFSGVFALALVYWGFMQKSFALAMLGMICSAIPTMLLNIISNSVLKIQAEKEAQFRQLQGRVGSIAGACFLAAALLAPWLVHGLGLGWVLLLDACTYLIGGLYMASPAARWIINLPPAPRATAGSPANAIWRTPLALQFILLACSAYLVVGVMPLAASSNATLWGEALNGSGLRAGSLWCLEACSALGAGLVYGRLAARSKWGAWLDLPLPPAIFLVPMFLMPQHLFLILPGLFLTALSSQLKFMRIRDNFLLQIENGHDTVRASTMVNMVSNALMFASPLLMTPLVEQGRQPRQSLFILCLVLLLLQMAASLYGLWLRKRPAVQT